MLVPIILPYKLDSESALQLKKSLNTKLVKVNGVYKYKSNHLIINLGNSHSPIWRTQDTKWINKPENVAIGVNKLKTFNKLKEGNACIPFFSTDKKDAIDWLKDGYKVVCRELLTASQGRGIVIATKESELSPNTKLYVRYFPKKFEYRVHLVKNGDNITIFDFVQKKKRADIDNDKVDYQIRNHDNGWVFARDNVKLPTCVKNESIKAMKLMDLDLASVDVCFSQKNNQCVILEFNTASGLEGQSITNYINEILFLCNTM